MGGGCDRRLGSAHIPRRGGGSGSGGGPGGLASERVGADGSGSPSSRRSCGAPGTSGQCQARGRRENLLSPGLWFLSAWGLEIYPTGSFGGRGGLGRGKPKFCPLERWSGVRTTCTTDLEKGQESPHLSSPVKRRREKTHAILGLPSWICPRNVSRIPLFSVV